MGEKRERKRERDRGMYVREERGREKKRENVKDWSTGRAGKFDRYVTDKSLCRTRSSGDAGCKKFDPRDKCAY